MSTRAVESSPIGRKNVARLHVLWRTRFPNSAVFRSETTPESIRGLVATPIVVGSKVYVQDSTSSVYAIDRATGKIVWEHRFRADNYGRNGLTYGPQRLYGSTDTTAFCLSATTGRLLWQHRLITPAEQYVDIAPLVANGLVYLATVGYPPGGRGVLYALDARTGATRWTFATIRGPWPHPTVAGGGGAWYTPSVDAKGNVYFGIANPYPLGGTRAFPNGAAYGGDALYTDSLVYLNGRTGRLLWYDQVTPRDTRDYDFQLPAILAGDEVLDAGKGGLVLAWNASSHKRLWETAVGRHLNDKGPLPTHRVTVCPGFFGGVETPIAYAGNEVYVPVVDLCARGSGSGYQAIATLDPTRGRGEFLALDARTGKLAWRRLLPQPDFGCATVADGVVFTSTFDGRLYGFDTRTGATLWQTRAPAGIAGCPALSGDLLLVPAGAGSTRRLHPKYQLVAYTIRGG
jgi:alcohol dehydrogenase (cytochrome c)